MSQLGKLHGDTESRKQGKSNILLFKSNISPTLIKNNQIRVVIVGGGFTVSLTPNYLPSY